MQTTVLLLAKIVARWWRWPPCHLRLWYRFEIQLIFPELNMKSMTMTRVSHLMLHMVTMCFHLQYKLAHMSITWHHLRETPRSCSSNLFRKFSLTTHPSMLLPSYPQRHQTLASPCPPTVESPNKAQRGALCAHSLITSFCFLHPTSRVALPRHHRHTLERCINI